MFDKNYFTIAAAALTKAFMPHWGNQKDTSFNRMFGSMFPGHSPMGPSRNKPSGWIRNYRKKRDKLNRIAFESRRKNWRK